MRVLIFTEGGNKAGFGHISRCTSLYDELVERGIEVEFIINSELSRFDNLNTYKYRIVDWLSKEFLTDYIKYSDFCIVDSYLVNLNLCHVISRHAKKTLYIDDNGRIQYPNGIIVNPSLNAEAIAYPLNDMNHYLLGPRYIMLRKAFFNIKRESINTSVKEVLITLGGSDVHNLTQSILELIKHKHLNINFSVVIGSGFNNPSELKKYSSKSVQLYENATSEEMKFLMTKSDLAITAAGQTIYELLATQTPFIPIKVVENQHENILSLEELRLIYASLNYNDVSFKEKLIIEFEKMMNFNNRKVLFERYQEIVDGSGSKRIIEFFLTGVNMEQKYFLRKVKDKDIYDVFNLSNEDYVRKYSINTKKNSWENHEVWFDNVVTSKKHKFYVVTDCTDEFFGQIRYEMENENAIISISLCKLIAGKGLSKKLLLESLNLIKKENNGLENVIAFVSKDNIASKKLFEKVGFVLSESTSSLLKYNYSF